MFQMVYKALLLSLKIKGHIYQDSSIGTGSIVAIYNAVDRIFKKDSELIDYRIDSVTEGTDAKLRFMLSLLLKINMLMV